MLKIPKIDTLGEIGKYQIVEEVRVGVIGDPA